MQRVPPRADGWVPGVWPNLVSLTNAFSGSKCRGSPHALAPTSSAAGWNAWATRKLRGSLAPHSSADASAIFHGEEFLA
jgi:hypothetical protein